MDSGKREKRPNPRDSANPFSALFFLWTIPIFRTGIRRDITNDDLFDPRKKDYSAKLGDRLEKKWLDEESRAKARGKLPSLRKALVRTFGLPYASLGLLTLTDMCGRLLQPQLLGGLLRNLPTGGENEDEESYHRALYYAGGMAAVVAVQVICLNHYMFGAYHNGMRVRVAVCSLIYRKALRLSQTALGETAAGQMVNLLSNDVSRFDMTSVFMHYMWVAPIVTVASAVLMYREVDWPAFVGVGVVVFVVPVQAYTGKLLAGFRKRMAMRTDQRVRFMDEVVSGIRVIKMYAWEKPFTELVRQARRLELAILRKSAYCRAFFMTVIMAVTRVGLFATLVTMALATPENRMSSSKIFVVLAYFSVIANTVCIMFIRGVGEVAEVMISVQRIEKFLHFEEFVPTRSPVAREAGDVEKEKSDIDVQLMKTLPDGQEDFLPNIEMKSATFRWEPKSAEPTLKNLSLGTRKGELLAVVGQVGSGKSSLLQAVLGELPVEGAGDAGAAAGRATRVRGSVSYASQEPWVFAATVRQNILFGQDYDRQRYERVVRVCALQRDFQLLPRGDLTVVGQRGAALSGGQKARINLARAVYRDADIYLLDDPLSAVDTHVGRHLFDECIMGFLKGKTRILVTHQLQYLKDADRILVLHNGEEQMLGDFNSLAQLVDYASLLAEGDSGAPIEEPLEEEEEEAEEEKVETPEGRRRSSAAKVTRIFRRISSTRSRASSRSGRTSAVEAVPEGAGGGESEEDRKEQSSKGRTAGKSPYMEYFRAGTWVGHGCCAGVLSSVIICCMALLFLGTQTVVSTCDWYISYWTGKEEIRDTKEDHGEVLSKNTYVYIYSGLVGGMLVLALTRSLSFYSMAMRCSSRLHHIMFAAVLRTHIRFFDINPAGRILNRFSKDMGTVDEQLPMSMLDATQIILQVTGSVVVSALVSPWLLLPVVVLAVVFWVDRHMYLRTSQNIKRLEGIAKSPVFTHLHATLQGLTTVRAFGAQEVLKMEFDRHQDLHTSAWYMYIATANAFGFSLDFLVCVYITTITFILVTQASVSEGVGLAITQAMSLTGMLQWGVRQTAEVANNIMAVERVVEYSVLEPEPNLESPPAPPAPEGWPSAGELQFEKLSLTYGPKDPPVLHNLTLHIKAGEKVGVVGRTGAGKSSLIAALFRLAWRVDGELKLDGVDTAAVALQELRARLAVIPQDPVLFSGTMRRNLDPFEEFPDYKLWQAVEEVELKEALPDASGLEARVAEGGSNYSVGQRQLVCLARALLRGAKVLVLDEATANVDPHTDALIQRTLRKKFSECTVVTVAHRLNTVMDSDKVLVMDAGRVAEFDHPYALLQRKGVLHSMVQETGRTMAEQLTKVAEECYNARQR